MLKKLLTLCLALAMLSVAVMASPVNYTLAADLEDSAEEITEEKTEEFDIGKFTVLRITETEAEGVVSQTAATVDTGNTLNGSALWLLVRVEVGKNWDMDNSTLSLSTPATGYVGTNTAYYVPSTEAAFADASDKKLESNLTKPSEVEGAAKATASRASSSGNITLEVKELPGAAYANSYDGTYLYFAIEIDNGYVGKSRWASWKLTVDGEKRISAVTEAKTEEFGIDAFTVMRITENEGVQTAASQSTGSTIVANDQVWLLVKVAVGENWVMNKSTLSLYTVSGGSAGEAAAYYVPSTKAAFDDASDGTLATNLTKPSAIKTEADWTRGATEATFEAKGHTEEFSGLDCVDSYDGENLYFAIEFVNGKVGKSKWALWKLTVDGEKRVPAVTDFSDAVIAYDNSTGEYTITTATTIGEAYLIIASFTGNAMNDVELVSINAAEGLSGIVTPLDAGTIKIFLLDKATLAPAIGVTEPTPN